MASTDYGNDANQSPPPLPDINTNTPDDPNAPATATSGSVWDMVLCRVAAAGMIGVGEINIAGGEAEFVDPLDGGPSTLLPYATIWNGQNAVNAGEVAWQACNVLNAQPPVYYSKGPTSGDKKQKSCSFFSSNCKQPPKDLKAFPDAKKVKPKNQRKRWRDSEGKIYEWDYQHGAVEIYNKTGKQHLGEFNPETGEQLKPADPSRTTDN